MIGWLYGSEDCDWCEKPYDVEVPVLWQDIPQYVFTCPHCQIDNAVENLPRIAWKLDTYSKTWYTTLVHRYTKIDNETTMRFDYYDSV